MPFSVDSADRVVRFFERLLVLTKGEFAGLPFILSEWQEQEIIRPLFGTIRPDGLRQYRTAYVEIPRKNGKSTLAAGLALYMLFADGEQGAEIYGAASDKEQASIVFNVAAEMVRRSPELARRCKIIDSQKRIVVHSTGSFYRAIPAEEAQAHGFNAHAVIFDELHTQPNRSLWDVLSTSFGARSQPLLFAITTAGYDTHSICWEQHEYAEKIERGVIDDPTYFAYIKSAPREADWTSEKVWQDANPALGEFRNLEEMRMMCKRAMETPSFENTFRRLYLNQWTSQSVRWLPLIAWDECNREVQEKSLKKRPCWAGLDLASTTDIAALVYVFPFERPDGKYQYQVLPRFFIPEENMHERVRRDKVPYDVWVRKGLVTATAGNVIDYAWIIQQIEKDSEIFDIKEIAYDRWGATKLIQDLEEVVKEVVPFGQGYASMSPPTKELLNLVLSKQIDHGGNPVLRWMADNMVVKQDPAGNIKPDKSKSTEKIDGMVALIMAIDRATRQMNSGSVYNRRGLLYI